MSEHRGGSAAAYVPRPPRALTDRERRGFLAAADCLIPDGVLGARPSQQDSFRRWLDRALAARQDAFALVTALAARLSDLSPENVQVELRLLAGRPGSGFDELSTIVAGAYLMVEQVREALGYPEQAARPPRFDEAAEEIMSGILDPVQERGAVYRTVPRTKSG